MGTGTPASCTEAAFAAELAQRSVRFNCGPAPVTIPLTSEKVITGATTVDGGGLVTLSGGGTVRIFRVEESAALDVRNLRIADGRDYSGGGISNGGTATVTNCTLSGNSATLGGGIANSGTLALANCTLSGNSASYGGGIANSGTLTVTNCMLGGNSAGGRGGGITNLGTLTLTNCTLSENGGAISNDPNCSPPPGGCGFGSVRLTNTIIAESAPRTGAADETGDNGTAQRFAVRGPATEVRVNRLTTQGDPVHHRR